MTAVRFLLIWCALSVLVAMLWAIACGPADLSDGDELWPDEGRGR